MFNSVKKSKALNEVEPVKNINKNLKSFLEISPVQKEILSLHKLQNHAQEQHSFGLKEDNPPQGNCHNQFNHQSLSHIEQEYQ